MILKDWMKRERISAQTLAAAIGISKVHMYQGMSGEVNFGYEVCKNIEEYTKGEVTVDEMRRKMKVKCPTCGRLCGA